MMLIFSRSVCMLLILALALPAAAATFYVAKNGNDTNACTDSYPCLTLRKGFSKAVRAGDIVIVRAGTYVVTPNQYSEGLSTTASGTATSRIRYLAELKWSAKIVSSGAYAVWRNYGSYVDIQGFEIVGDSASNLGIDNRGSSVRVMDNKVHHIPASQGCINSNGGAGIDHSNYSASDNDTLRNLIYDIGPFSLQDSLPAASYCATVQGIYHANLRGHIHNNIVYSTAGFGIQLWHAANQVSVSNNLVFNNGAKTDKGNFVGGGILAGAGDSPGNVVLNDMTLSNNMVIYNRGAAIREYGATGPDNRFLNNLLFGNGRNAIDLRTGSASGTITLNPVLANFKLGGSGDYHLTAVSPARNAGTNTCAPAIKICAPTDDYDRISRPKESFYDVGPYEFGTDSSSTASAQTVLPCDLNGDGATDALDIQLLVNAITSESRTVIYDLNKDGQVSELDRYVLENVLLGRATCP